MDKPGTVLPKEREFIDTKTAARIQTKNLSKHLDECGGGLFKIFPFYKIDMCCDITREVKGKNISKIKPQLKAEYAFSIVLS